MHENIHQILKDAGAAKGITSEEVMTLFILGNEDLFQNFLSQVQKEISAEEFVKVKTVFEAERKNVQKSQKKYEAGLQKILANTKTDIFTQNIEKLAKENPQALQNLDNAISAL